MACRCSGPWPTARRTSGSTTCRGRRWARCCPSRRWWRWSCSARRAATTRAFADQGGYDVDVNRDFVGVGAGQRPGRAGRGVRRQRQPGPHRGGGVGRRPDPVRRAWPPRSASCSSIPAAGLLTDVPLATLAAILIFVATRLFHVGPAGVGVPLRPVGVRPRHRDVAHGGLRRRRAGHRRRRGPRHPRPHPALGSSPQLRAGQDPRHHELGAAQPPRPARDGARRGRRPVAGAGLLRQRGGASRPRSTRRVGVHRPRRMFSSSTPTPSPTSTTRARRTVRALVDELDRSHVTVAVARAVGGAPQNLARSGLRQPHRPGPHLLDRGRGRHGAPSGRASASRPGQSR